MRVIAGLYRGLPLLAPEGRETRPILDRVKVSLFDWLGSRLAVPGALPALHILDLFCGSGSLGIEALSRGAATCTFIDASPRAVTLLRANLAALRVPPEEYRVLEGDAGVLDIPLPCPTGFDLVFFDPPYRLSEDARATGPLAGLLARLGRDIATSPGSLLLWRHDERFKVPESLGGSWRSVEQRVWGSMAITMFEFALEARS